MGDWTNWASNWTNWTSDWTNWTSDWTNWTSDWASNRVISHQILIEFRDWTELDMKMDENDPNLDKMDKQSKFCPLPLILLGLCSKWVVKISTSCSKYYDRVMKI